MTTKYDHAFDLLKTAIDGIEKLKYFTHDECWSLEQHINEWLTDMEINEPTEKEKIVEFESAMGTEGL